MRSDIRLVIAGFEINTWDKAEIDSANDTPSEGWSFSLFDENNDILLPNDIKEGAKVQLYYGNELLLTSVADTINSKCDRTGFALAISGRDLAGQLIDCSVPIFNGRQMTLDELLNKFVLGGDLSGLFKGVNIQDNSWLKNKVSVEPGESIWDAISKSAAVTGQHVWLEPDGTLSIGDPFANAYRVQTPLKMFKPDDGNNVLVADYKADISGTFSEIKILSQDGNANSVLATGTTQHQYGFKRVKIISMGDVETKAEADIAVQKIIKDNNLQAYGMTAQVVGWEIDSRVWQAGFYCDFESNRLTRAAGKWAVMGRTLSLTRQDGMLTSLKLNRQGDWAQPMKYKEPKK